MPEVPAAAVPASVPPPVALRVNVMPAGSVPVTVAVARGKPVLVTVKVLATPTPKVAEAALVIAGAWFTVKVNDCTAGAPLPLDALNVNGYVPPVPAAAVPARVAVPFGFEVNVTPAGNVPVSEMVADPFTRTVNVSAVPTMKVVDEALVNLMLLAEGAATKTPPPKPSG